MGLPSTMAAYRGPRAELEAARITATYARNRRYAWASLREALSGYPTLSAQVPDRDGQGPRTRGRQARPPRGQYSHHTEAEIEAARKGRTVVGNGRSPGRRR